MASRSNLQSAKFGEEVGAEALEESFNKLLARRSVGLSSRHQTLAGFSVAQLRAPVSTERFDEQVNPTKHGLSVTSNVSDVELEIDSRRRRSIYKPGDVALVPRGTPTNGHVYRTTEFVHILMEQGCIERVSEESDGSGRVELLPIFQGRDELLRHLAHSLVGELGKGPALDKLYADILTRAIVAHTVKNMGTSLTAGEKNYKLSLNSIGRVIDYVAENLGGDIGLEDVAAVVGVSPSKLHKQFKKAIGMPLHQYVLQQRVKRARELLISSRMPVAEIAYRTGFADQSHLTRVMRQHTGLTPKVFRAPDSKSWVHVSHRNYCSKLPR